MGIFSEQHDEESVVVLIDICSASVAIGCMLYKENHVPRVIYSARIPMKMELDITFDTFFRAMITALDTALSGFVKDAPEILKQYDVALKHVDDVIVTVGSPWYTASLRTVERRSDEPFEVTEGYIDAMLEEDMQAFSKTLDKKKQVSGNDEVAIVDQSVLELKVNGYVTTQREADSVTNISASVFASVMSEQVYDRIVDHIEKMLGVKNITMHALPLALFAVIRDIAAIGDDFAVVDIGGEVSDCLFVREGVPELMYSVPMGHNTLLRDVSKALSLDMPHAASQLAIYAEGKSDAASGKRMQEVIQSTLSIFQDECAKVVSEYAEDYTPPQYAFLTAGRAPLSWVRYATGMSGLNAIPVGGRSFDTVILGEPFLSPFSRVAPETTFDTGLVIQALFANTLIEAKRL